MKSKVVSRNTKYSHVRGQSSNATFLLLVACGKRVVRNGPCAKKDRRKWWVLCNSLLVSRSGQTAFLSFSGLGPVTEKIVDDIRNVAIIFQDIPYSCVYFKYFAIFSHILYSDGFLSIPLYSSSRQFSIVLVSYQIKCFYPAGRLFSAKTDYQACHRLTVTRRNGP